MLWRVKCSVFKYINEWDGYKTVLFNFNIKGNESGESEVMDI